MKEIDKKAKAALLALFDLVIPEGMTAQERSAVAKQAGINPESLRVMRRRKTVNADTLIRLLLARGVSLQALESLHQTDSKQMLKGELDWQKIGRELSDAERTEFSSLVRMIRAKWRL